MIKAPPRLLGALLALAALAACDSGGGDSPSNNGAANNGMTNNGANNGGANNGGVNNGQNNGGEPCAADADCGQGEVCDEGAGSCRPGCAADADCAPTTRCGEGGFCVSRGTCDAQAPCAGAGEVCDTCQGRCVLGPEGARVCQSDANCFEGQFCDPCAKICRAQGQPCEPCQEDLACGDADDLCLDLRQGGRVCGQGCGADTDCPRGFLCEAVGDATQCVPASGNCQRPAQCGEDQDCPAGSRCGPLLTCVPGCTEGTCPNGEVCDAGSCKPPCADDAQCPAGAACDASGLCKVPGGCLTSRDCAEAGTYCDQAQQRCVPGCFGDADCPGLQVCRGNQCMRRPCDGNHLCAFGQVCDKDSGQCVEPEGPYCDPCDAEAEGQCGGEPNRCLRLQDDEGNELGDYCMVACDPTDLDACPVGYTCTELMDENGQPMGAICVRGCHRDPV
jgi:hypothetical protein